MTREEFFDELQALIDGLPERERGKVGPSQLEALWEIFGRESVAYWQSAILALRVDGRWPTRISFTKALENARASGVQPGQKKPKVVCECGGQLNEPESGPRGCHVVDVPLELDAMGQVLDRRDHPERWGIYMFRLCSDCGTRYLMATERRTVSRRDGTKIRVEPGMVLPIRPGYTFEMPPYDRPVAQVSEVSSHG